ncbi:MAG: hypothetical protein MZV64_01605 [Ignavibacteriales bacterium]|nr:hypothetical protein [Ignavibacteriales bacterium]
MQELPDQVLHSVVIVLCFCDGIAVAHIEQEVQRIPECFLVAKHIYHEQHQPEADGESCGKDQRLPDRPGKGNAFAPVVIGYQRNESQLKHIWNSDETVQTYENARQQHKSVSVFKGVPLKESRPAGQT